MVFHLLGCVLDDWRGDVLQNSGMVVWVRTDRTAKGCLATLGVRLTNRNGLYAVIILSTTIGMFGVL